MFTTTRKACDPRLLILLNSFNKKKKLQAILPSREMKLKSANLFFQNASFAGGLWNSTSTSRWFTVRIWITHVCFHFVDVREAGAVSHSRTESERISLEAGLRTDGSSIWGVCVVGNIVLLISQGKL